MHTYTYVCINDNSNRTYIHAHLIKTIYIFIEDYLNWVFYVFFFSFFADPLPGCILRDGIVSYRVVWDRPELLLVWQAISTPRGIICGPNFIFMSMAALSQVWTGHQRANFLAYAARPSLLSSF